MDSLVGYLIAGALLAVGLWLRFDEWRAIERRRLLSSGGEDFSSGSSVFADAGAPFCHGDGCGQDGGGAAS